MAPSVACLRYSSRATLISISVSFPFSTAAAISLAAACVYVESNLKKVQATVVKDEVKIHAVVS